MPTTMEFDFAPHPNGTAVVRFPGQLDFTSTPEVRENLFTSLAAEHARLVADLVNSFSPLALTASTIVAITGATTAWLHLKRISALWTTSYGLALMVKLVLVLIVVVLGAWNWKRVRPALAKEGSELTIRRSATMELAFAALVLIATSVLVTLPSPK